jgi:phenol/toluene 2-monooxygenase (NADH) P0/A0
MRSNPTAAPTPVRPATELPACDTTRRFVRVIEERADGLVAFEFAIGWPELSVELLLPAPAFAEFCATNQVQRLDHRASLPDNERRQTR